MSKGWITPKRSETILVSKECYRELLKLTRKMQEIHGEDVCFSDIILFLVRINSHATTRV